MTQLVEVVEALNATLVGADGAFQSVSTDTRTLGPGQLFVALEGPNFDGHNYLLQAERKRAAGAIVSKEIACQLPLLKVEDTRIALGQLAAFHRAKFEAPVVAVTGSCGKTSTKSMVANILQQRAQTLSNQASFNNDIGVPLTLLRLTAEDKFAVVEMGANHPGEISYLTQIGRPQVAVITNIAPSHLEGFGTLQGVAAAKSEIFQGLGKEGIAVINADDTFAKYITSQTGGHRIIRFGIQQEADIKARNVLLDQHCYPSFTLVTPEGQIDINLPLMGEHSVMNALAAAACTYALGFSLAEIHAGLSTLQPVNRRMVPQKGIANARIFDDSYNANPLSFDAALRILVHQKGKKILVIGDMGELGENVAQFHQELGAKAHHLGVDHLFAVGEYSQLAAQAFGENGACYPNHKTLIDDLVPHLNADVTVLVKGSRRTQMENVVHAILTEE